MNTRVLLATSNLAPEKDDKDTSSYFKFLKDKARSFLLCSQ